MNAPDKDKNVIGNRRRWVLGTLLSLAWGFVAFWFTANWIEPKPVFQFTIDDRNHIQYARQIGPWCIMDRVFVGGIRSEYYTKIYDFDKHTFSDNPSFLQRSGFFHTLGSTLRSCDNRFLVQTVSEFNGRNTTIRITDTTTGNPAGSLTLPRNVATDISDDGKSLVEMITLPLAPFSALTTNPCSSVTMACQMACDEQRLYTHTIGPVLVIVRRLPDFLELNRFALPARVECQNPAVTADGKYLLYGNSPTLQFFLNDRQKDIYANSWKRIQDDFPEQSDFFRQFNPTLCAKPTLNEVWPHFSSELQVYDLPSGTLKYSLQLKDENTPAYYRAGVMSGDWAFFSSLREYVQINPSHRWLAPLGCLHIPSGKFVAKEELPAEIRNITWCLPQLVRTKPSRGLFSTNIFINSYRQSTNHPTIVYRFLPEGKIEEEMGFDPNDQVQLVANADQWVITRTSDQLPLPDWLRDWLNRWSVTSKWLNSQPTKTLVTAYDGSPIWKYSSDASQNKWLGWPLPIVSQDGRLLFISREASEANKIEILAFQLPLSHWLPWWPRLAGIGAFLVVWLLCWCSQPKQKRANLV